MGLGTLGELRTQCVKTAPVDCVEDVARKTWSPGRQCCNAVWIVKGVAGQKAESRPSTA